MIRPEPAQPKDLTPWCETQLNILTISEANMRTSAFVTNNAPVVNKQGLLTLGIGKTDTANEGFWAFCRNVETGLKAGRVQTEINEFIEYHKKVIRCAFGKPLFQISNKELAYIEVNINLLNRIVSHCHNRFYERTFKPDYFDTRFLAEYLRETVQYALNKEGVADAIARLRLNGVITWDNPHFVDLMESYKKIQSSELLRTYLGHRDQKTKRFLTVGKACQLIIDTEEQLKKLPFFRDAPSCMVALKQALRNNVLYNEDVEKGAQLLLDAHPNGFLMLPRPHFKYLFPQFAALGARYLRQFAPNRLPPDLQRMITVNYLRDHPFTAGSKNLEWISEYERKVLDSYNQQLSAFSNALTADSSPEEFRKVVSLIYAARDFCVSLMNKKGHVDLKLIPKIQLLDNLLTNQKSIFNAFKNCNDKEKLSVLFDGCGSLLIRAIRHVELITVYQLGLLSEQIFAKVAEEDARYNEMNRNLAPHLTEILKPY